MKVYVVEEGAYEGRRIAGVYLDAESAMTANPVPPDIRNSTNRRLGQWRESDKGRWENGLDLDYGNTVTEYTVGEPS